MERTEKRIWSVVLTVLLILSSVLVPYDREPVYALEAVDVIESVMVGNETVGYQADSGGYSVDTILVAGTSGNVTVKFKSEYVSSASITVATETSNVEFSSEEVENPASYIITYKVIRDCKSASLDVSFSVGNADDVSDTGSFKINLNTPDREIIKSVTVNNGSPYMFSDSDFQSGYALDTDQSDGYIRLTLGDDYNMSYSVVWSLDQNGVFTVGTDDTAYTSYQNLKTYGSATETATVTLASGESVSVNITLNYSDEKWRDMISISFNGSTNDFYSTFEAPNRYNLTGSSTTSSQDGSVTISSGTGYNIVEFASNGQRSSDDSSDGVGALTVNALTESGPDANGAYTISFQGLTGSEPIELYAAVRDTGETETYHLYVTQTVTYSPPIDTGGGGGGGGSDDPPAEIINVINEDNPENLSNDTILTSNHTTESGDTSTTKVSSAEADALIDLAEQHAEDIQIEEGDHEAVINVESQGKDGIDTYVVVIAAKDEQKIEESIIDVLSIATPAGDFRIRTEELAEQTDSKPAEFKVTLTRAEHEGRAAVEVKLELAKENIQQFEEQYNVEIRIPYTPAEDEDVNGLIIEYVATDGETFIITESHYDADKGMLCFFAPHLSKYGVAYNPKFFSDVKTTHWASGYITFLASRGIISGMGNGKFQPDAKVTKAQFITMMTNAFSKANIGQKAIKSYKDVKTSDWFAKQMGWSYINNLSNVLAKNGYIYPNANLTREDMATLSNNISLGLSLRLKNTGASTTFSDGGSISSYATSGVQRMVACGILNGAGGKFFPKNGLTRAEAAKVISVLISSMK